MYRHALLLAGLLASAVCTATEAPTPSATVPLDAFVKQDRFNQIKLSPTGEYYAVSVPLEDRTVLLILRRSDMKQTGLFNMRGKTHVADFWWVNDERVVIALGEKMGGRDQPVLTGELAATNADGSKQQLIFGYRMEGDKLGSAIKGRKAEWASAFMIDDLPGDRDNVLIGTWSWKTTGTLDPHTTVQKLDVYSGRRITVAQAPVRAADFVADPDGVVRFAFGSDADNQRRTYYRDGAGAEWTLINDEKQTGYAVTPLAFSADGKTAYLQVEEKQGPDGIYAFDPVTRERKLLLRDEATDPDRLIWSEGPREPIGAIFMDGRPRAEFFKPEHPLAKLHGALQNSFGGEFASLDSYSADGRLGLIRTWSDRSPGDYYLFDLDRKKADHVLSQREAIDPARMGERRPITLKARDGLELHGFLTIPAGSDGRGLPLVVNPHGGPFDVADTWQFDLEPQLLASRGYAVLQVNFRGSGNHGRGFMRAGFRQWGGSMQDDLTDATRWAVGQGIADPKRVCIYGASYGGYAALMGVAREPDLYRCAVGYVGVYDMKMMYGQGDVQHRISGENYLREALGTLDLDRISPTNLADRIKAPVFLAAGGADQRAPKAHTEAMERALKRAGVPVEMLIYDNEGHGFYVEAHRREYYQRLFGFLDRHIGAGAAAGKTASN